MASLTRTGGVWLQTVLQQVPSGRGKPPLYDDSSWPQCRDLQTGHRHGQWRARQGRGLGSRVIN